MEYLTMHQNFNRKLPFSMLLESCKNGISLGTLEFQLRPWMPEAEAGCRSTSSAE